MDRQVMLNIKHFLLEMLRVFINCQSAATGELLVSILVNNCIRVRY